MSLTLWFKSELNLFLDWFGLAESKVTTFAKPIITTVAKQITDNLWADIEGGIPIVVAALTEGIPAALIAAEQYILPLLKTQGIELEQLALNLLSSSLVAQAQVKSLAA